MHSSMKIGTTLHGAKEFLNARNPLLALREDYETARRNFPWPVLTHFKWALDYFDKLAYDNNRPALRVGHNPDAP